MFCSTQNSCRLLQLPKARLEGRLFSLMCKVSNGNGQSYSPSRLVASIFLQEKHFLSNLVADVFCVRNVVSKRPNYSDNCFWSVQYGLNHMVWAWALYIGQAQNFWPSKYVIYKIAIRHKAEWGYCILKFWFNSDLLCKHFWGDMFRCVSHHGHLRLWKRDFRESSKPILQVSFFACPSTWKPKSLCPNVMDPIFRLLLLYSHCYLSLKNLQNISTQGEAC